VAQRLIWHLGDAVKSSQEFSGKHGEGAKQGP